MNCFMPPIKTAPKNLASNKIKLKSWKMSRQNKYTCNEYRQEMILLSLRMRLNKKNLPESERKKIESEIQQLEASMKMT